MPFVKGMKRHPAAGVKKGSKIGVTKEAREKIGQFIEATVPQYTRWLKSIENPKERCDLWLKTVEFYLPRLVRSEVVETPESVDNMSDAELDKLIAISQEKLARYQEKLGITSDEKPIH